MLRFLALASVFSLAIFSPAVAQGSSLDGTHWVGSEELKIQLVRVAKEEGTIPFQLELLEGSRFRFCDSSGSYTGNYTRRGKTLRLELDLRAKMRLEDAYARWTETTLREQGITAQVRVSISSWQAKVRIKETRRGTSLQFQAKVKYNASARGFDGWKGKVKAKATVVPRPSGPYPGC